MVSSLGFQLQKNHLINGFGFHRAPLSYHHTRHVGSGVGRRLAGSAVKYIGTALLNKLSNAISGDGMHRIRRHRSVHRAGSYKVTGASYRRNRAPVRSLGCGYRKRKSTVRRVRPTVGGYKRKARLTLRKRRTTRPKRFILI